MFEAVELRDAGWDVTYIDVRKPPDMGFSLIQGDASSMDLGVEVFDACSSTCVLCHAGLGRYGDDRVERGDVKILANIHRALKKGAKAAITFGPVYAFTETVRRGSTHRIYCLEDAEKIVGAFKILERKILDIRINGWVYDLNCHNRADANYLSMLLEKP